MTKNYEVCIEGKYWRIGFEDKHWDVCPHCLKANVNVLYYLPEGEKFLGLYECIHCRKPFLSRSLYNG